MKFDTSSLKTFSPRTALIGVGAILIALFVVIFVYRLYGTVMGQGEQGGYPVPVVEVIEASKEEVDLKVSALGTLQADQAITVRPEITGIVTSIDFTDGTRIEEGDTIVTLDDRDLKARLMQSEARLTLTRANYQRAERLLKQGSGTARARDEALNDFKSAEAEVAATETALDKATIKAPFTGIIGLRQVSLGQFLTAGDATPLTFQNEVSFNLARQTKAEQQNPGGQIIADDEPWLQDLQRRAFVSEGLNHVDEVSNISSETVESMDHNGIAVLNEVHEQGELRSALQAFPGYMLFQNGCRPGGGESVTLSVQRLAVA